MTKCYRVYSYGGEWEDKWEKTVGITMTIEEAHDLIKQQEKIHFSSNKITLDQYESMLESLYEYEDEHGEVYEDTVNTLCKLFPEYTEDDIQNAVDTFDIGFRPDGFDIEETYLWK